MIGKRRFVTVMTTVLCIALIEGIAQFKATAGLGSNAQIALLGIMATYFGFDMGTKRATGGVS